MEGGKILMSQRELQRFKVMSFAEAGKITLKGAGEKMGVSYRQAKRMRQAIRREGVKGLIHGNRGRPPGNRISEEIREQILGLSQGVYQAFNDTHFTEQLKETSGGNDGIMGRESPSLVWERASALLFAGIYG